jgi:hypothetical protein
MEYEKDMVVTRVEVSWPTYGYTNDTFDNVVHVVLTSQLKGHTRPSIKLDLWAKSSPNCIQVCLDTHLWQRINYKQPFKQEIYRNTIKRKFDEPHKRHYTNRPGVYKVEAILSDIVCNHRAEHKTLTLYLANGSCRASPARA